MNTSTPLPQWEYKIVRVSRWDYATEEKLNRYGDLGWKLASATKDPVDNLIDTLIFVRMKVQPFP